MSENQENILRIAKTTSQESGNFELFNSIFEHAENGISIINFDGNFVKLNKIYAQMFGYEKEELLGKHYSILIAEDSKSIVDKNHFQTFNDSNILKAEEKVKHKNGTFFYIQTTNLRVNDEQGNKLRISTAINISNRLRNELVQSVLLKISNLTNITTANKKLYSSIHKAICQLIPIKNFAICIKNKLSNTLEFPYIVNQLSIDEKAFLSKEYNYIIRKGSSVIIDQDTIDKLIEDNQLLPYKIKPKSILGIPLIVQNEMLGSLIFKDYFGNQYTSKDSEILELVAAQISRIIERKNYEEELVYLRNKAETAVKLKSEFLAQISHEIRTPLNSILSFSSLIKDELNGTLTEELEQSFKYIERGGSRLTRTIDLILNVSKMQNQKYKIELEEFDLYKEILFPILKELRVKAADQNIELIIEKPENVLRFVCDHYSVTQLFINLIENAIKYTKEGTITVKSLINEFGKIQIDIHDTGIGISVEYLPKLFEPFSQEEQGYTRSYEGIGLGLSLVKRYADLNNAELKVDSKKNIGSVFSVIFN